MKKLMIAVAFAASAIVAGAEEAKAKTDAAAKSPDELCREYLKAEGGDLTFPGTPSGTIRFVNLQKRVPVAKMSSILELFHSTMAYDVKIVDADCEATLKIKIIDDAPSGPPTLLVAPEDRWAQINVAKLSDAKAESKPAYLASRLRKEMLRAYAALVFGSTYGTDLFSFVSKPAALDDIADEVLPIDLIMRSGSNLRKLGLKPAQVGTYRSFVNQGYDIAPTNDYQRVIYEKIKSRRTLNRKFPQ